MEKLNPDDKLLNDAIHGHVKIESFCLEFIGTNTPQFQRLRDLKQLGVTYFVFPGASHNRFEHSIGVSILAHRMITQLQRRQKELDITEREIRCVTLAGLCHDLGHGPFSHSFESWLKRCNKYFAHEDMSIKILDYLIDDNGIDIESDDIKFIKSLILGIPIDKKMTNMEQRNWIYEIVSNKRNSIDVDKWDYLARDAYSLGVKYTYDFARLMHYNRVIEDEICFHRKEAYNIYEMFHTRYTLFKQVYSHRVVKSIELMLGDIYFLANPYLKIIDSIYDVEAYCGLTDCILKEIENSKTSELAQARELIHRLRKRDLYSIIDTVLVGENEDWGYPDEREMVRISNGFLSENDIVFDRISCNYASERKNPVDSVYFFDNSVDKKSYTLEKKYISLLIPSVYSEKYIRLFCKHQAKSSVAFKCWNEIMKNRIL